ncbi:unnamed protein product [Alternaria sp. RS040]
MDVNADTDGLVRALLKPDEADRSNIVEHLPPDKVKNAFLLLLRETAGLPGTSDIATFGELADALLLHTVLQEQPLAHTPLAVHPVSAQEPVTTSNKRSISTAITDDSKRARIDATVAQNAKQSEAQIRVKEEEIIEITSEAEDAEAETDVQSKAKDTREPADLKMYLQVPFEWGLDRWREINRLPAPVRAELERRFEELRSFSERNAQLYVEYTRNLKMYMPGRECINSLLNRRKPRQTNYSQIGEPRETACGECANNRKPCAFFAKYKGRYIIYLVPLHKHRRKGKRWTEIGYWVQ